MFPATTHASKDTPKEERRRVPSYDKSIQGGRKVKRGKKERKKEGRKERKKERERRERRKKKKADVPSYEQSSRDTPKKERGYPEYSIQETTKKQRKKGGGKGKGGD